MLVIINVLNKTITIILNSLQLFSQDVKHHDATIKTWKNYRYTSITYTLKDINFSYA